MQLYASKLDNLNGQISRNIQLAKTESRRNRQYEQAITRSETESIIKIKNPTN